VSDDSTSVGEVSASEGFTMRGRALVEPLFGVDDVKHGSRLVRLLSRTSKLCCSQHNTDNKMLSCRITNNITRLEYFYVSEQIYTQTGLSKV